jgi:prepilin signal peptidase PulO-like enzyme (type II secretory pathway)
MERSQMQGNMSVVNACARGVRFFFQSAVLHRNTVQSLAALLPGAVLFLLSFLSRQKIGCGDGLAVMALGSWNGAAAAMLAALAGMFYLCVYGVLIDGIGKYGKKRGYPFLPFLAAGYLSFFALYAAGPG